MGSKLELINQKIICPMYEDAEFPHTLADEISKILSYKYIPEERPYIAISIDHSNGQNFTLWGYKRTFTEEERCFAGYVGMHSYDKCELYTLEEFQKAYGNKVCKTDEPVPMSADLVKRWKKYDTVLVKYDDFDRYMRSRY